jgi:hypothetical protein
MIVMPPVFNAGDTIYFFFDTYDSNGASVTITGLATSDIEVYKNGSTTQRSSDSGYALLDTDGIDFDTTTGLHGFSIDTSDNTDASFWVDGAQYLVHVNAITVDSQTVRFSYLLTLGYLLRPTTAGRKLDVSSGGEAGLDWANVGSPTTTVGLSGTTVKTATDVETDTADIQSRLPAALTGAGNIKADSLAFSGSTTAADNAEVVFDTDFATNYNTTRDKWQTEADVIAISGDSTAADNCEAAFDGNTYNVGGGAVVAASVTGAVGSVSAGGITASSIAADAIGASELAADAIAEIADAVWDEATSGHTTAGTFGQQSYIIRANTAQAGAGTSITLDASASATDDIYNNTLIVITGGTGAGQARFITAYNGTTKVATVATWAVNPSSDSVFVILPFGAIPGATAPTAAEVADAVWDESTSGHTTSGTFGEQLKTDVDAILVDTAEIGAAGAGLTAVPWNASWDAEVQSEVQDAIEVNNLDHLVKSAVDTDFATTVHLDSVLGQLADNGSTATFDRTTDSLEAQRDNIGTNGSSITAVMNAQLVDNVIHGGSSAQLNLSALSIVSNGATAVQITSQDASFDAVDITSAKGGVQVTANSGSAVTLIGTSAGITATGAPPVNLAALGKSNASAIELTSNGTGVVIKTTPSTGTHLSTGLVTEIQSGLSTLTQSQVNTEVDTALSDINLDHLIKNAVDTNFATTVHLDSVVGQLADNGTTATFDRTTESLEALRDRGDSAWTTGTGTSTLTQADIRTAVGLASANLDNQIDAIPTVTEIWTTALTEAYRATGATGTAAQLIYEILGHLINSSITSTTKTVTKLDKATTAKTYTLDSATTPTAIEETT